MAKVMPQNMVPKSVLTQKSRPIDVLLHTDNFVRVRVRVAGAKQMFWGTMFWYRTTETQMEISDFNSKLTKALTNSMYV